MLKDILDEFITYLTVVRSYSPRTLPGYRSQLEQLFTSMSINIPSDITVRRCESYLEKRLKAGISQNTNAMTMNAIRAFLIFCNKRGYGRFQLDEFETPRRIHTRTHFLTEEEVSHMLSTITNIRDRLMLLVLFTSGCRVSELVQLSVENFRDHSFQVVAKGRQLHTYLIDRNVADELQRYINMCGITSGQVFRNTTNRPIGAPAVNFMLKKAAKKANISHNVSAHQLRRGFGTAMSEHGADMREIQAQLGHASILTTQRYVSVSDRRLEEAHDKYAPKVLLSSYPQNSVKNRHFTIDEWTV